MRLPRDLTGAEQIQKLNRLGYRRTWQTCRHVRLSTDQVSGHHVSIPLQGPLHIGAVAAILGDIAGNRGLTRDELSHVLFDRSR